MHSILTTPYDCESTREYIDNKTLKKLSTVREFGDAYPAINLIFNQQKTNERNPDGKNIDKTNLLVRTPTFPSSNMIIYRAWLLSMSVDIQPEAYKMSHSWNERSVSTDFRLRNDYVAPGMSLLLPFLFLASILSFFPSS
jgi:hypothetical protein